MSKVPNRDINQTDAPSWVPSSVKIAMAEVSRAIRAEVFNPRNHDYQQLERAYQRLCSDQRMLSVWKELMSSRVSPPATNSVRYKHPVDLSLSDRLRCSWPGDRRGAYWLQHQADLLRYLEEQYEGERSAQDVGLMFYFLCAFYLVMGPELRELSSDLLEEGKRLLCKAEALRSAADTLEHDVIDEIYEIAEAVEQEGLDLLTDFIDVADPQFVTRARGEVNLREYVIGLASITELIFGKKMYGTVATTANVALDRTDIALRHVREMMRARTREPKCD